MGTPDFAVASLAALLAAGHEVVGVVTATDKMGGRGGKQLIESDVKKYAVQHGLRVLQPEKLKNPDFLAELRDLQAEIQVVVAFRMLPEAVWNMPPLGTINLHGSLLPRYRGAAPINWAIINGEAETGVSTFFLQQEIDTGDLLLQSKTDIGEAETFGDLYDRLKIIGAQTIIDTLYMVQNGTHQGIPQNSALATAAPKIFAETCQIDFAQSTQQVFDFIRGLSPHPTAWCYLDNAVFKIISATKRLEAHDFAAGTIVSVSKKQIEIATLDGFIAPTQVQPAGKKRMPIADFLNGYTVQSTEITFVNNL